MKTKKLLSLLLALMMMLSVVPMYASAADPIALTEANVTVWPTANGSIYFGQKLSDGITLSGGEVQYDGTVVAGHFEFNDVNFMPTSSGNKTTSIKFIPDNASEYVGFSIETCYDVTYTVKKTTPIFVNENDTVPVATEVEPGAKLSTSKLSGAKVKNPYYGEEPKALAGAWKWSKGSTVVTESGYYEAKMTVVGYEILKQMVFVKVKENTVNTTIVEAPTVGELTYDANKTWADVTLTGGKAVEEGTETEVTGTFAITKVNGSGVLSNKVVSDGDTIEITFTPADTDKYLTSTTTITVTVGKGTIKFVDENGADVIPECTISYGYALSNDEAPIFAECRKYLNTGDENIRLYFSEEDSKTMFDVGTYELTIGAAPYYTTSNYLKNDNLKVKITVEPKKLNPKVSSSTEGEYIRDNSGTYNVKGTFDIYVDDVLVQSGIKYLEDKFELTFPTDVSKTYTIKIVYKPVENDNFVMDDIIYQRTVIADRNLTFKGTIAEYKLGNDTLAKTVKGNETICTKEGNTVKLESISDEFAYWIITDINGKEVDLDIKTIVTNVDENGGYTWETVDGDLTSKNIVFTMPTYDIIVTQKTTSELAAEDCDHLCHSDNVLAKIVWKVMSIIFRLFDVQQYCDCGNLHYDKAIFG